MRRSMEEGDGNEMKKPIMILVICIEVIILAVFLILNVFNQKERVYNAKVRYFDGVTEMLPVKKFDIQGDFMHIVTSFGDSLYFGANNIILVEEVEE